MYLNFIIDIIKQGDLIKVSCGSDEYVGRVVKITEELLAISLDSDSSIKILKDEQITDVYKYPQENIQETSKDVSQVLKEFNITTVYHGHIHGSGFNNAISEFDGIKFKLISADCIDFTPFLIV